MTKLSTDWVRIGRSGDTVDGRVIPELALTQAAESYSPELFTALIWPEHQRWDNWGKVLALKSEKNPENGTDLYAQLEPNRNYLGANTAYQDGLFTSMELTPNFRKTGKWYLSGLGATNEPASVATTEIRFSKQAEQAGVMLSKAIQTEIKQFPDDRKDSFFKVFERFFSTDEQETDTMSDKALTEMQAKLADLEQKFSALSSTKKDENPADNTAAFSALTVEHEDLKTKFATLEEKDAARELAFSTLKTEVESFKTQLADALKEDPSKSTASSFSKGAAETAARLA